MLLEMENYFRLSFDKFKIGMYFAPMHASIRLHAGPTKPDKINEIR